QWTYNRLLEIWKSAKLRRNRRNKTEAEFQYELQQWQASQPPETIKTSNSMTQHYYSQEVLPKYIQLIQKQKEAGMPAILMEDGDPSHGHRSEGNMPPEARRKALIQLHDHPLQSPELNPIEGIWLLLNERLKQVYSNRIHHMGYWQLRKAVEASWDLITLEEIRERISDMQQRCKKLISNGGARVKGEKW
ncbi:MAG: hypothetical protein FE78DRAFT_71662, partial [Acidomyces sp. 'richmondensis']